MTLRRQDGKSAKIPERLRGAKESTQRIPCRLHSEGSRLSEAGSRPRRAARAAPAKGIGGRGLRDPRVRGPPPDPHFRAQRRRRRFDGVGRTSMPGAGLEPRRSAPSSARPGAGHGEPPELHPQRGSEAVASETRG